MRAQRVSAHRRPASEPKEVAPPPLVPGSRSLRALLPESYREGDFADRFIAGFDDTLAPIIETLDCLEAYFGPRTAPADFLEWMLSWTGTQLPDAIDTTGRRNALLLGRRLHGLRGTRAGLELLAREVLDARVEMAESGGTRYGQQPQEVPAQESAASQPWVDIRIELSPMATARCAGRTDDIEALVRDWIPAHVSARVTITTTPSNISSEGQDTTSVRPESPGEAV